MLKREAREILGLEDDADLRVVSDRMYDICEYLCMLHERGELRTDFGPLPMTVTYHAPCQQQGHGIGKPALDLMALVPELRVIENDATCCGVAGTYGLKTEKYEIAMDVGAGLFGQIEDARPELAVCDSETCRWHIEKATGVRTVHPVEILHRAAGLWSVVGLVIVSHSATLAAGVVELARQMGGDEVAIEPAGGMADPPGEIGTDMELVLEAIAGRGEPRRRARADGPRQRGDERGDGGRDGRRRSVCCCARRRSSRAPWRPPPGRGPARRSRRWPARRGPRWA